jgi:hypothetical protein
VTGATVIHTRDRRRYVLAESCGARRVWDDIRAGRPIRCETSIWDTRRREIFETVFNPDNVVAVTES